MSRQIKCAECSYYWADYEDELPYCHYQYNDGYAPCEIEDKERETEDDD